MTRRQFAIEMMRKDGCDDKTIQTTLRLFDMIGDTSWLNTEMESEAEKEMVRRMFKLPAPGIVDNN